MIFIRSWNWNEKGSTVLVCMCMFQHTFQQMNQMTAHTKTNKDKAPWMGFDSFFLRCLSSLLFRALGSVFVLWTPKFIDKVYVRLDARINNKISIVYLASIFWSIQIYSWMHCVSESNRKRKRKHTLSILQLIK